MTKRTAKAVEIYSLKSNERYTQRESKGSPSLNECFPALPTLCCTMRKR